MSVTARRPSRKLGNVVWIAWGVALAAGIAIGASFVVLRHHAPAAAIEHPAAPLSAAATWQAGARSAPNFRLTDQHGSVFTLQSLHGRAVLLTFIDPLCRNLCPLEARVLSQAERSLPAIERPAIVSVSVNPWGDTQQAFHEDAAHWKLAASWRWGIAGRTQLERVWRGYHIGVLVTTKTLAGVTVHEISHTEATYLIDATGHERALFLYPFSQQNVADAVRRLQ